MSRIAWVIRFCAVNHWELKVGVALHFGNQYPWSSANRKGDRLPRLIDTDNTLPRSTYLLTIIKVNGFLTKKIPQLRIERYCKRI